MIVNGRIGGLVTKESGAGADAEAARGKGDVGAFSPVALLPRRALRGISMLRNWHQLIVSYPRPVFGLWAGGGRPRAGGSVPMA